jgi:hypothetical protein
LGSAVHGAADEADEVWIDAIVHDVDLKAVVYVDATTADEANTLSEDGRDIELLLQRKRL